MVGLFRRTFIGYGFSEIAMSLGRKVVLLGRGVRTHAGIARSIRALQWPNDLVIGEEYVHEFAREKLLVFATGSQGEQRAALGKLSRDEVGNMRLQPGDAVILSSRVIPGHEMDVVSLTNNFIRKGIRVVSRFSNKRIHVSGHAHRDEQKRMIELLQPAVFVPVHGTLHHMVRHAELAREAGVRETLVMENGTYAEADLEKKQISVVEHRRVEKVFAFEGRDVPSSIVRERMDLARAGLVTALVEVKGNTCFRVVLRSFGALDLGARDKGPRDVGHAMEREVMNALLALPSPSSLAHLDWETRAHETVRREVRRLTKQEKILHRDLRSMCLSRFTTGGSPSDVFLERSFHRFPHCRRNVLET